MGQIKKHFLTPARLLGYTKAKFFHWLNGSPKAPVEFKVERLQSCISCDMFDPVLEACLQCGCYVDELTSLADKECPHPDGPRWPSVPGIQRNESFQWKLPSFPRSLKLRKED
jgi:hypothetical protein